jgi:hypothetical protein
MCTEPFCACHFVHDGPCCECCKDPVVVQVTLGLALPDYTWIEQKVLVPYKAVDDDEEELNIGDIAFDHYINDNEEEVNRLMPSGWFLIHVEWPQG